jgi:hypothetical protein
VESSFVPLEVSPSPTPTRLDPNLGHLIATDELLLGGGNTDSDSSDDRPTSSSLPLSPHRSLLVGGRDLLLPPSLSPSLSPGATGTRPTGTEGAKKKNKKIK